MSGFIEGEDRNQATLFPERIDDYITEDSAVRVIDVFVDELDLSGLGFKTMPEATGRPGYHPALMLKLFIYGYLNRVQSSRRLEQEANRNLELIWLLGKLAPDFKTIADFRKNNGEAIRLVCREFVMLCRKLNLFSDAFVAIDGSKFRQSTTATRTSARPRSKRDCNRSMPALSVTWARLPVPTVVRVRVREPRQNDWRARSRRSRRRCKQ